MYAQAAARPPASSQSIDGAGGRKLKVKTFKVPSQSRLVTVIYFPSLGGNLRLGYVNTTTIFAYVYSHSMNHMWWTSYFLMGFSMSNVMFTYQKGRGCRKNCVKLVGLSENCLDLLYQYLPALFENWVINAELNEGCVCPITVKMSFQYICFLQVLQAHTFCGQTQ